MADKRISQLIERVDIANNDVLPIVASGATTTNKVTISTIQNWMQDNLDVGVTSVGITLGTSGTDVNVTGSPITTSGNITINIPTASDTNRGLLSAADWSTFNGKQNSITLTTSGTSGAATLVGSTLNIPNYSTGVANAYVPYVGAIGSVTLGYNSLSASQINIDGASPTGGSYLGFKHSTSVNTGTDGYTSMYTFGTNTIAFKSVSGGNSKDFSFSMVGITPNVAGGRQYTLPDASGTLALTSDLSGYVTLGTAQTITGSKTFNSRIIGQDATLTGSGSADTLEVTHTSGSGIAVDISKAGDGEGLRVIKTSGSGNAVTISGGLLSAASATFSGALNGTTASFTGAITSTGTGLNPSLRLTNTTASTGTDWHLYSLNNGNFGIYNNTAGAYSLQIASTGAATFSSSIDMGLNRLFTGGGFKMHYRNSTVNITYSGTSNWQVNNDADNAVLMSVLNGGNVGIGTASPSVRLQAENTINSTYSSSDTLNGGVVAFIKNASTTNSTDATIRLEATGSSNVAAASISAVHVGAGSSDLTFGTRLSAGNVTEKMRITSGGQVLMNLQSAIGSETLNIKGTLSGLSQYGILISGDPVAYQAVAMRFFNSSASTVVGSIVINPSSTSYNTSSDYRLKEDFQEVKGLEKVQSIKVYDYKWKAEEGRMDGVLAHELAEVLPYAVTGEKDDIYEDGTEKMQGVDYSKIVPVLIKAIQEQQEQIKSLTEQVEALKSQING